jgi:hypothetical protein
MEQARLTLCRRCGELKGQALIDDPWQGWTLFPVICICKGIACRSCGKRMVRRPGSNRYDEQTADVWHMPWFGARVPCADCRRRQQAVKGGSGGVGVHG